MNPSFRQFAGFALALIIALTSVTMALARGQTRDATGTIIICSGAGVVQIQLDAKGNPVGPAHICPDCAVGALAWVEAPLLVLETEGVAHRLSFNIERMSLAGLARSEPRARGPPAV